MLLVLGAAEQSALSKSALSLYFELFLEEAKLQQQNLKLTSQQSRVSICSVTSD